MSTSFPGVTPAIANSTWLLPAGMTTVAGTLVCTAPPCDIVTVSGDVSGELFPAVTAAY